MSYTRLQSKVPELQSSLKKSLMGSGISADVFFNMLSPDSASKDKIRQAELMKASEAASAVLASPVGAKHCSNCGAAAGSGSYCSNCGSRL